MAPRKPPKRAKAKPKATPRRTPAAKPKAPPPRVARKANASPPVGSPRGRRTILSAELIAEVCQVIREGAHPEPAAVECGIGRATFYEWKQRGDRAAAVARAEGACHPDDQVFADFAEAVDAATSATENEAAKALRRSWQGRGAATVRAATEYLSRRAPKRWGRIDRLKVEAEAEVSVGGTIDVTKLGSDDLKEILRRAEKGRIDDGSASAPAWEDPPPAEEETDGDRGADREGQGPDVHPEPDGAGGGDGE